MRFSNGHPEKSVHLFWLDPQIEEESMIAQIEPEGEKIVETYAEQVWLMRASAHPQGKLLRRCEVTYQLQQHCGVAPKPEREDL